MNPSWMLIDGSSLIFRAYYGVPSTVKAPDGRQVNAVRGFLETLARLIASRRPSSVAITTDEDWRPAFRTDVLPTYKAHRVAEPIPPALDPQVPLTWSLLEALGIHVVRAPGFEAEDVIASLLPVISTPVEIVSGDRDLFALVRDPDVRVLYPERAGLAVIDEAEIERRYHVPGRAYADYAILRGDPSDGLPGVPGVGEKTASGLIRRHGSLAGILAAMDWSDATRDYLERAARVVLPRSDIPLPPPAEGLPGTRVDVATAERMGADLGVTAAVERLRRAMEAAPPPR